MIGVWKEKPRSAVQPETFCPLLHWVHGPVQRAYAANVVPNGSIEPAVRRIHCQPVNRVPLGHSGVAGAPRISVVGRAVKGYRIRRRLPMAVVQSAIRISCESYSV